MRDSTRVWHALINRKDHEVIHAEQSDPKCRKQKKQRCLDAIHCAIIVLRYGHWRKQAITLSENRRAQSVHSVRKKRERHVLEDYQRGHSRNAAGYRTAPLTPDNAPSESSSAMNASGGNGLAK